MHVESTEPGVSRETRNTEDIIIENWHDGKVSMLLQG